MKPLPFDILTLLRACAAGDVEARCRFQDTYAEDIYNFPIRRFDLPLEEASAFYLYVFEEDRIFQRLRTFEGRNDIPFLTFLFHYPLKHLFLEWRRTLKEIDTISLHTSVGDAEEEGRTLEDILPDHTATIPGKDSDPEEQTGMQIWDVLSPEEQLSFKLFHLIQYDLTPEDVSLLADRSHRSIIDTLALVAIEKTLGPNHPDLANPLNNLAARYQNIGEYQKALPLLQRALTIREKALGHEHPDTALSLASLASIYESTNDDEKALDLFQQVLRVREKVLGPDHPATARTLIAIAGVYARSGAYQEAIQFLQRGLTAQDKILASVFAVGSEEQKLRFLAQFYKDYFAALFLLQHAFSMDNAAVRSGLELVLRRKAVVLEAQSRMQQVLAANLQGEALQSWQRLTLHRSALSRLLLGSQQKEPTPELPQKVAKLQEAIAREEEFLAQQSRVMAQEIAQRQVTAQMLAERLPKDSALVEIVRIPTLTKVKVSGGDTSRYLAFVLAPNNQVTFVDLGEVKKIDAKIGEALAAIDDPEFRKDLRAYTNRANTKLTELYDLLLRPLEPAMGSAKRLIVSPDGEISKVPFAALRTPDGHYLIEKMTVSYVASGRDLLRGRTAEEKPTIDLLLAANPAFDDQDTLRKTPDTDAVRAVDYGQRFDPLPGTAEEARIIPSLLTGKQQVLQGKEATESAIRSTTSPKVLHLATHGFFLKDEDIAPPDPLTFASSLFDGGVERGKGGVRLLSVDRRPTVQVNPMVRSGLALTGANHAKEITAGDDGILTALEVTGMNLYGTDLVVLSACDTGVGDVRVGEGVYGLRRAFVLAGAKNLVMSLWAANDKVTLHQMEEFYRGYSKGKSPAVALREAQLKTIARLREQTKASIGETLAPVRLWAPFIVQQTGETGLHETEPATPQELASPDHPPTQQLETALADQPQEATPSPELHAALKLPSPTTRDTSQPETISLAVQPQSRAGYGWWNLVVPLLAMISLLVLSRVRLSEVPAEVASIITSTPAMLAQPVLYARFVRQSPIDTLPQEIAFIHEDTLIGSGPECDAILRHPSIARQHARVLWRKQGYVLRAEQGKNSTFINNRPITENLLKDGWTVRLGEVEFVFYGARPQT